MLGRRPTALVLGALLLLAACSGDPAVTESSSRPTPTDPSTTAPDTEVGAATPTTTAAVDGDAPSTTAPASFVPGPLDWSEFADDVDVALLDVPVDYTDPQGPSFELFVARHRALDPDKRIGSLLINPGGPGFGGTDFAVYAPQIFDSELLDHFDIVAWDPRGTGESTPAIDCIDDYDPYFTDIDSTPSTDEQRRHLVDTAEEFAQQCIDKNADILDFVGTNDSARDMDSLRQALGEDTISYFGFSYGSELGAVWATLFPDTVRAAVLDGASDRQADPLESSLQQTAGFEASLETFLQRCAESSTCAFDHGEDTVQAFVDLMAELDANPLEVDPDRPPVNRDVALTAVSQAMYSESYWPSLEASLAAAENGDGAGLLALNDAYYQRHDDGTYGNELEAFQVITCADTAERLTVEEVDAQAPQYHEVAPLLVPEGSVGGYFCTFFPPAADPRVALSAAGAGPIVVIGTTGDAATPLKSTRQMASALEDGRLVIVEADQHTGYGVNRCIVDVVDAYLIDLEAPPSGTECR